VRIIHTLLITVKQKIQLLFIPPWKLVLNYYQLFNSS